MKMAKSVDEYIDNSPNWTNELNLFRSIFLKTEMVETVKWGMPTYIINGKNVAGFSGFKNHFGIWFFQGVFLKDPLIKLVNAQEGKTKGLRQWRFKNIAEINEAEIFSYLEEAIQNQKDGKMVKIEKRPLIIPAILQDTLDSDSALKVAFNNLTLSNRRDFTEHIESAKQTETKLKRLKKIIPMIIQGIGLNDKYKK